MLKFEPSISAYRAVRQKRHGIGEGSRLRALKMALAMFALVNQNHRRLARFAWWLTIYGTPLLPKAGQ